MPLNSPAITEARIESAPLALLQEWLRLYYAPLFDANGTEITTPGLTRAIGAVGSGVLFPRADIRFQEGRHPQPLKGLGIRATWLKPGRPQLRWETVAGSRQQRARLAVTWMFWVRSARSKREDAQAEAMTGAELLFAVLENSFATRALGGKGIHHVRPETPVFVSADENYALRQVTCSAELRYAVMSQG